MEEKEYKVTYRNRRVLLTSESPIRQGICRACKRKVGEEIKNTQRHHWKYAYTYRTVRNNPRLALENTVEYCYPCHKIADAITDLTKRKDPTTILTVLETAPNYIQDAFERIVQAYLVSSIRSCEL